MFQHGNISKKQIMYDYILNLYALVFFLLGELGTKLSYYIDS